MRPINRPGFPRHGIHLNNPPGKKKIQAILSKVKGPQKVGRELGLNKEIQANFVKNVTDLVLCRVFTNRGTNFCQDKLQLIKESIFEINNFRNHYQV